MEENSNSRKKKSRPGIDYDVVETHPDCFQVHYAESDKKWRSS